MANFEESTPQQVKDALASLAKIFFGFDKSFPLDRDDHNKVFNLYTAIKTNANHWLSDREKVFEEMTRWPVEGKLAAFHQKMRQMLLTCYQAYVRDIVLGKDVQTEDPVFVTQENLESGTYVVGVQGVGKSSLLLDLLLQQMSVGESVIVLDPHGDLVRDAIARMPAARLQDTYLFDLKEARKWPFGLNIFALPADRLNSPEARDSVRNQVIHAFEKLWPETRTGLYFGNVLRPVISTLMENQELTLAHVPRLFYNDTFREHYTRNLRNIEAQDFWGEYSFWSRSKRERQIDPLLDRIRKLLSDDVTRLILCQKQSRLDLAALITQRKNILLRLPLRDPAYEYAAPMIGTFFMTLLQAAIFSFGNMAHARRPGCTLVIDEFQNFVTEDNERFFSEGRKYKVKQILAHQYMSQLDRDGLTTMKQAATSAYTIVAFRTNRDDSTALAPLFSGLQRTPTDLYIDVLPRLEKHPSPTVKEFYWHIVRPLETAAKLRETTERWTEDTWSYRRKHEQVILPSYDFGFGTVEFAPQAVTALLSQLNLLLYYAQKNEEIREQARETFLEHYGKLTGCIQTELVDDEEIVAQIETYRRAMQHVEEEKKEKLALLQAAIEQAEQQGNLWAKERMEPLEQRIKQLHRQNDTHYYKIEELKETPSIDIWGRPRDNCEDSLRIITYTDLEGVQRTERVCDAIKSIQEKDQPVSRERHALEEKVYQLTFWSEKGDNPWTPIRKKLVTEYEMHKIYGSIRHDNKISDISYKIRELEKRVKKQVHRILPAMSTVRAQLQQVLMTLIAQPLAADNTSFSSSDIASALQQQPNREAHVKIASTIFQMRTRDLADCFTPVSWQEADQRRNTILAQTKRTYCRGRATVEQEIAAVYQIAEPEEKKDKDEPPPPAAQPAKSPKKPPSGGKKGESKKSSQPDLFDRLDADEPVD